MHICQKKKKYNYNYVFIKINCTTLLKLNPDHFWSTLFLTWNITFTLLEKYATLASSGASWGTISSKCSLEVRKNETQPARIK
jgi:hypothetical protein